jgi:tRNA (guanine37-N1)-methyltransferase
MVCGRYAGIDQRAVDRLIDEELSIGDYVLSGGEIPALAVIEAVSRLVPGVLGNRESARNDSFPARLESGQYTRPRIFGNHDAPEVIAGGDHKKVDAWRKKDSLRRTLLKRPDLLLNYGPDRDELRLLQEIKQELIDR